MVIKRGISSKLFILFFSIVLVTFSVVLVFVTFTLQSIAQREVFFRLNAYCDITSYDWEQGIEIKPNMDSEYYYGIVQGTIVENNGEEIYVPSHVNLIPDISEVELIQLLNTETNQVGTYTNSQDTFFYTIRKSKDNTHFILMLVNDNYSTLFTQRVVGIIVFVFCISLFLMTIIFVSWLTKFLKRIKKLQNHVKTLNKSQYEVAYLDNGDDEIAELSHNIEVMRMEIKEAEATKREMLQNVSHDFKTPIAVIKNYAEAIEDGVLEKEGASVIVKQAEHLKSKVNQLLQYNRLEYLNSDKPLEDVNLKIICQEIINHYKIQTNIIFEGNLEDCFFKGYAENFNTVIENIVDNALRYAKTKIVITTKKNKITIYNDGEPIEEQFLTANFKPYEKGSKGQFGLGMSIVKKTLDFFNLKLKVYNETYGGVSFVIYKDNE